MPRWRTRTRARSVGELDGHARHLLRYGITADPPWPSFSEYFGEGAEGVEAARLVWQVHRDELMAWMRNAYPCRRPWGWWRFDAPPWEHLDSDPTYYYGHPKDEADVLEALGELDEGERAILEERRQRARLVRADVVPTARPTVRPDIGRDLDERR